MVVIAGKLRARAILSLIGLGITLFDARKFSPRKCSQKITTFEGRGEN
jgi:hypothetical protein